MNAQVRMSVLLLAAMVAAGSVEGASASDVAGASRDRHGPSIATGRISLTLPSRGLDVETVRARLEATQGPLVLVSRHEVLARGGHRTVLVFEAPQLKKAGATDADKKAWLHRLGRDSGCSVDEVRLRMAKGKPRNSPILPGDLTADRVRHQDAMAQVSSATANARATGAGQIVALIDGGLDLRHEFLQGHLTADRYDAIDDDADPQDLGNGINDDYDLEPADDHVTDRIVGHGTFVASLILSAAPDVQIMPIRALNDEGWGTEQSIAFGISYAVDHGATVINMSLVLPVASDLVKSAVQGAIDRGVMIVSAGGTTDDGYSSDPYIAQRSICVGPVDETDVVPSWALTQYVRSFAPGIQVLGALGGNKYGTDTYGIWDGVSFAVPFLSAGAALVKQRRPTWDPFTVRNQLMLSDDPVTTSSGSSLNSRGRIDLNQAVPSN